MNVYVARSSARRLGPLLLALSALVPTGLVEHAIASDSNAADVLLARPLGTLIFRADEREELERARRGISTVQRADGKPTQDSVRVDGYVLQPKGASVLWLNGKSHEGHPGFEPQRGSVLVRVNKSAEQHLAPGQRSGEPELGAGNSIEIHRERSSR